MFHNVISGSGHSYSTMDLSTKTRESKELKSILCRGLTQFHTTHLSQVNVRVHEVILVPKDSRGWFVFHYTAVWLSFC